MRGEAPRVPQAQNEGNSEALPEGWGFTTGRAGYWKAGVPPISRIRCWPGYTASSSQST
jgi:hypothetical protein